MNTYRFKMIQTAAPWFSNQLIRRLVGVKNRKQAVKMLQNVLVNMDGGYWEAGRYDKLSKHFIRSDHDEKIRDFIGMIAIAVLTINGKSEDKWITDSHFKGQAHMMSEWVNLHRKDIESEFNKLWRKDIESEFK